MVRLSQLSIFTILSAIQKSSSYCPVVICPGFGNDSIDYTTPLSQPEEVGLKSVLSRRGFEASKIYTIPVQRSDWIRVAGGLLDIPDFYTGNAQPTGLGYGWYIKRLKESVDKAYEESGEKVLLLGHSAGGWLARAALGDGVWCDDIQCSDRISGLVTMGAIHKVPLDESSCVTRGALKNTDLLYPGAYLSNQGIKYVSIGGAAVQGELVDKANEGFEAQASRVAYTSYEAVSGVGNSIGDGVVPFEWTQLDGSKQIQLDGVVHSINEAGTTIPTDRWYGSENVIDRWLPDVLEEFDLVKKTSLESSPFDGLKNFVSNIINPEEVQQSRRNVINTIVTASFFSLAPSSQAMYENAPIAETDKITLPSGVSIQDIRVGDGEEVSKNKRVNIQWVLKRSNGYFIDSSLNNDGVPFIFIIGNQDKNSQRAIKGLDEGIVGMKIGGIRRIVIPPSLAYIEGLEDGMPGPIPREFGPKQRIRRVMINRMDVPDESFVIDVKATRVQ